MPPMVSGPQNGTTYELLSNSLCLLNAFRPTFEMGTNSKQGRYGRSHIHLDRSRFLRISLGHGQVLRHSLGTHLMEYILAGLISLGLAIYLLYALLRPERF